MPMSLKNGSRSGRSLLLAMGVNAVFLALALLIIAPGFESNDDRALAAFVDGQMAQKSAYIPYINFALAALLKGVYLLLGDGAAWNTIGQYLLIFAGFTAISWTLFSRLRPWQGAVVTLVMLLFFGVDLYTLISYTKTAAVATVGGLLLMLYVMEYGERGRRALPLALGLLLALFGSMLRFMEFLPCAALTAVLGLRRLWALCFDGSLTGRERLSSVLRYLAPFALLAALAAGLYVFDDMMWSRGPFGDYDEFDAARIELTDYGIPEYKDMPEVYESLDLNENAAKLYFGWNFFDTEKFDLDTVRALIAARNELKPAPSLGECLGKLLDDCIPRYFINLHIYGFLIMALLWLATGEHGVRGLLTLLMELGLFAVFYLYLIWRGRYMVDRVDVGLFLAMFAVLSQTLSAERLEGERTLCALLLLCALGLSVWISRSSFRFGEHSVMTEDRSGERAAVETIVSDEGHLYLAKIDAVSDTLYSPFMTAPAGYADRIVLLGGWYVGHPVIADALAKYGVEDPYRDIVGNDRVYIIDDDIGVTLRYIRDYYAPDAEAELVEPLSGETGLDIYRILAGGEEP